MTNKKLGKGLGSLLATRHASESATEGAPLWVPLDQLRQNQSRFKALEKRHDADIKARQSHTKKVIQSIRKQLRAVNREATALRRRIDDRFHAYWGSLLKQESELSLFGYQVDRYACVYTARVSNLLAYSPNQYFRSPRGLMHHEL